MEKSQATQFSTKNFFIKLCLALLALIALFLAGFVISREVKASNCVSFNCGGVPYTRCCLMSECTYIIGCNGIIPIFTCEQPIQCSDGSFICRGGTCPSPSPSPPPPPGSPPPPPPPPPCSSSAPTAPALSAPANGAVMPNNDVPISWTQNGTWGTGCPQNNQYRIFLSQACTGTYVQYTTVTGTNTTLNNLNWGTQYCWFVQKHNGSQSANSAVRNFTVNVPPTVSGTAVTADACGNGMTGRIDSVSLTKSNPLPYRTSYTDVESDIFRYAQVAFVPTSATIQQYVDAPLIEQYVMSNNSIAVRIANNGTVSTLSPGNGPSDPPGWNISASSGNLANNSGTATIMNIGGVTNGTRMVAAGNNVTADFTIRYELTFPSGNYSMYVAGITQNSDGTLVSSNPTAISNIRYYRADTWIFDMVNPGIAVSIQGYEGNTFTAFWNGDDPNGLKNAYSYIWASGPGSSLSDITGGYPITPLGTTPLVYPASPNAGLTAANIPTTRQYLYSGATVTHTLRLYLEDNACNISGATTVASPPVPWIQSWGDISSNQGISDVPVPNISAAFVPDYDNPAILNDFGPPTMATFGATAGTSVLPTPTNRISKKNTYAYNYTNQASSPDLKSNQTTWRGYVLDRAVKNADAEILTDAATGTLVKSGNVSTYIDTLKGAPSNANTVYVVNLTSATSILQYNSGSTCDRKVIFISANAISISPDFRRNANVACVFVATNNITIPGGTQKTSVPLVPGGESLYDIVEAYLITDGTLVAAVDTSVATNQWDGLIIKGGVLAAAIDVDRTLNSTANSDQPAAVFMNDPIYGVLFRDHLATRYYSIREVPE